MKWTILFIIHGLDDGLQEQSLVLINVIRYGNWSLKYTNLLYLKSEIDFSKKGKPVNAVLNKVSSLSDKRRGKPVTTREKVFPKINIGSKAKLEKVFEYVRKEYPAEKLMLLVFDHGAGFGIFEPIPTTEKRLSFSNLEDVDDVLYNSKQNQTYQRFIPKASSGFYPGFRHKKKFKLSHGPSKGNGDRGGYLKLFRKTYAKTDMLTMEELSESIKKGFRRKVDVVVLINCNMQMIETGYSLKDNVDYLVASETLFWIYGINYREVLFRIDSHPSISPLKVATFCVDTMPFRYERIGKIKNLNDVSFCAIELKKMIPVYDKLDEFISLLLPDVEDHFKTIATARRKGVDLSQFS
ncbi:MAG: clostripain-related cysteine peptidase, partial [Chitinophagaceae bacterium]